MYLLQAKDSVTEAMFYWTSATADDADYTGPNAATELAVVAQHAPGGGGGGGDLSASTAPAELWVDGAAGDDGAAGTEGAPLLTMEEARSRIGNHSGDCLIHLVGSVTSAGSYGLWGTPRVGWGKTTIKGEGKTFYLSDLTVVSAGLVNGFMTYEVAEALTPDELAGMFLQYGASDEAADWSQLVISNTATTISIYYALDSGMPDPAIISLGFPTSGWNIFTPGNLHCGTSRSINGDGNAIVLINMDLTAPYINDGLLTLAWVRMLSSIMLDRVTLKGDAPNSFPGSPRFNRCDTHGTIVARFETPLFTDCGGVGAFSGQAPFRLEGVFFVVETVRSYLSMSGLFTGDVLQLAMDSRVSIDATFDPGDIRQVDSLKRTTLDLRIRPGSKLGTLFFDEWSQVNLEFDDAVPDISSFSVVMSRSALLSNVDLAGAAINVNGTAHTGPWTQGPVNAVGDSWFQWY